MPCIRVVSIVSLFSLLASACGPSRAEVLRRQIRGEKDAVTETAPAPAEPPAPEVSRASPAEQSAPTSRQEAPAPSGALESGFIGLVTLVEPGTATQSMLTPVRIGGFFGRRHTVMLGLGFSMANATVTVGNTSQNVGATAITLVPTYRYLFRDVEAGAVAPYLQAELVFGVVSLSGTSTDAPGSPFGVGVRIGAEYLPSPHFGVFLDGGLRYVVVSTTVGSGSSAVSSSTSTFSLMASAGLTTRW